MRVISDQIAAKILRVETLRSRRVTVLTLHLLGTVVKNVIMVLSVGKRPVRRYAFVAECFKFPEDTLKIIKRSDGVGP